MKTKRISLTYIFSRNGHLRIVLCVLGFLLLKPSLLWAADDPEARRIMEMVDMISAARAYEANLAVSKSAKNMINEALRMGR